MKKLILISIIALVNNVSFGQAKISIGIKGGLNFSKVNVDSAFSISSKTGFHGGAFALFKFSKIGIQPEIIFSQQGSKINLSEWETSYINIPILIKFYILAGLNLQAGPQFGFVNKAKLSGSNIKDSLKTADISAALGIGWDAPFGMIFNARYNLGLTDINDNLINQKVKNQVFQISAGIRLFKFGK